MNISARFRIVSGFIATVTLVIVGSLAFVALWGGKPEKQAVRHELVVRPDMTVAQFGRENQIPDAVLQRAFRLRESTDAHRPVRDIFPDSDQATRRVNQLLAIHAEEGAKNWKKILSKFALWFVFLLVMFRLLRTARVTRRTRTWLYTGAIVVFGVILGSDPSPMGTIKDALVLYGRQGVIFPPRMIAFTAFLLTVLLANKFICSWGCQLGVLQDFLFRLNRNAKDTKGIIRQYKPPFWVTNTIRSAFFVLLTAVAFVWSLDLVGAIDPFKVFHPTAVTWIGWVFIGGVLIASLLVYRPWCHLFCPFGLVGWAVEQISIFKVKVNRDTCTACSACSRACPSMAMDAILKGKSVVPDCFSCATCVDVCPTQSISFSAGKRVGPPAGKFEEDADPSTAQ